MKLQEVTQAKVGERTYYIRPFPAFKAANISGEVIGAILPVLGALLPALTSKEELTAESLGSLAPEISKGFSSLSGDKCEKLLRKLLLEEGNVATDWEGKAVRLSEDIANEVFCGEAQDMYVLAFHVIKVNYAGFFRKLGIRSGNAGTPTQGKG